VCVKSVDESGETAVVFETKNWAAAGNWSVSGIVASDQDPDTRNDIWLVDPEDPDARRRLIATAAEEQAPQLSPDGQWLAYTSDATGRHEVYVQRASERAQPWQISFEGGARPRWSQDGGEVVYVAPDARVMAVAIETRPTFRARPAQPLFTLPETPDYLNPLLADVSPDGRKLLLNLPVEGRGSVGFQTIFHWTSLLEE
jgi:dipeptidyl aminopeptidase/acylaminoacyl peptidase